MAEDSPFDWMARDYEKWHSTPKGKACLSLEEEALAALLPPDGLRRPLLEVGCGTAFWFPFWRSRGYRPFGLDPSLPMLGKAREKGETRLALGRGEAPPFRDGCFQVVAFITTLEFLSCPEEALDRAARLLAPGGGLLLGVLGAESAMARSRKASGKPPWDKARFFTARELEDLLSPFGDPLVLPARPLPPEIPPPGPDPAPEAPFFFAGAVFPGAPSGKDQNR